MTGDPHRVPLSKVLAFLVDIGLDPVDPATLRSVHFDPGRVTVTRARLNEDGQSYIVGTPPEVALETVMIEMYDDRGR